MITGRSRFNIYLSLLLALAAIAVCGCKSNDDDPAKKLSTLRIHLEVLPEMMDFSRQISVLRQHPVTLHIDRSAFLTESDVDEAKVVDDLGGFGLQIRFNRHGTWILEQSTTANPGKHFAIFSQFGTTAESRWLAAPRIQRRIQNGVLVFTPDCSREEAERIVLGLNNVAAKVREKSKW